MSTTDNYFAEQVDVISAALMMLNEAHFPCDQLGGFHIEVTLHDMDGRKVGFFSDEIGPDSWYYQPVVTE